MPATETRKETREDLKGRLAALLNEFSEENESCTPDFILAEFLIGCLDAHGLATNRREVWYGRPDPMHTPQPQEETDARD